MTVDGKFTRERNDILLFYFVPLLFAFVSSW